MKRGVESQSKHKESSKPQTQEGRRDVSKRLLEVHFLELKATSQSKQKTIGLSSYSETQNFMPILSTWTEATLNSSLCRWVSPVTIYHPMFLLTILEVTNMHQSVRQTISIPIITAGNSAEFITAYLHINSGIKMTLLYTFAPLPLQVLDCTQSWNQHLRVMVKGSLPPVLQILPQVTAKQSVGMDLHQTITTVEIQIPWPQHLLTPQC